MESHLKIKYSDPQAPSCIIPRLLSLDASKSVNGSDLYACLSKNIKK